MGDVVGGCGGVNEGGMYYQAEPERGFFFFFMYIVKNRVVKQEDPAITYINISSVSIIGIIIQKGCDIERCKTCSITFHLGW